jgi:methyl-accepting chemotaxis protein
LSNHIKDINKNKAVVVGAIHDISAVSEESAAATEEMSAAIDAQSSNMDQISASADQLYNISVEVKSMVSGFKIE